MTASDFISYWKNKTDHDDTPAVGIGVNWDKISSDAQVSQYIGEEAWEMIGNFYPPLWGNFKRTQLKEWLDQTRSDYDKFIEEEKSVGKIDLYKDNGLIYPDFCAIADESGIKGLLADGSHSSIDFNYLINQDPKFKEEIKKSRLDVICVNNPNQVLNPIDLTAIQ